MWKSGVEVDEGELVMGWQEVQSVIESPLLKGPEKAVLVALAHHINHRRFVESGNTEVWPAYPTLMIYAGLSESAVQQALKSLIAKGVVTKTFQGVGRRSSRYTIDISRVGSPTTQEDSPGLAEGDLGEYKTASRVLGATTQSTFIDPRVISPTTQSSATHYRTEYLTENLTSKKNGMHEPSTSKLSSFRIKDSANPETPTVSVREEVLSDMEVKAYLADIYECCKGVQITRDDVAAMKAYEVQSPVKLAHQLVWAYTKSNHWPKKLNGLRSFLNNLPLISSQYEKFYSVPRSEGKKIPETICPTLPSVLAWRRKAAKLSKATVDEQ